MYNDKFKNAIKDLYKMEPYYNFSFIDSNNLKRSNTIICDKGHYFKTTIKRFKKLKLENEFCRCPECNEIEKLKVYLKHLTKNRIILTNLSSMNHFDIFTVTCNDGHTFETTIDELIFFKEYSCPHCHNKEQEKYRIKFYDDNKQNFNLKHAILIDGPYKDYAKTLVICNKEHKFAKRIDSKYINSNDLRCPICENVPGYKFKIENMKKAEPNYKDISIYSAFKDWEEDIFKFTCNMGHNFNMMYHMFYDEEFRCPICEKEKLDSIINNKLYKSKPEGDLINYIKSIYDKKIEYANRKIIPSPFSNRKMEIDIYLPEIKLGIEFNGYYYHNDIIIKERTKNYFNSAKEYHDYKSKECKKYGVDLIHINELDYIKDSQAILDFIKIEITKRL